MSIPTIVCRDIPNIQNQSKVHYRQKTKQTNQQNQFSNSLTSLLSMFKKKGIFALVSVSKYIHAAQKR